MTKRLPPSRLCSMTLSCRKSRPAPPTICCLAKSISHIPCSCLLQIRATAISRRFIFGSIARLPCAKNLKQNPVARLDGGEPAILDRAIGQGRIIVFASGWNPEESELALSTKFVPLIGALLDRACGTTEALAGATVGQTVEIPVS